MSRSDQYWDEVNTNELHRLKILRQHAAWLRAYADERASDENRGKLHVIADDIDPEVPDA